jgi:crotonobetainyl-CoA:carnitine CoA-transferase CaiB-like acyl-CoA transferase
VWSGLSGVRVLEVGQYIAGPYAANVLGYFGAQVTKIEPVEGDVVRGVRPNVADDLSATFATLNLNKRCVAIDLKSDAARDIVNALIANTDVLIHNLKPGRAESYGLGADQVHDLNPAVVHCSISAFYPSAETGRPGFDILVQAESGIMSVNGDPDGDVCRVPVAMSDYAIGLWTSLAAMNALHTDRDRVAIRVCLQDVAMGLVSDDVVTLLAGGPPPQRRGSGTQLMNPHRAYHTSDGEIVVAAGPDNIFRRLAAVLGPPVDQERFRTRDGRVSARAELDGYVADSLAKRTTDEWMSVLSDAGIPCAIVRQFADAIGRHKTLSTTGVRPAGSAFVMPPPIDVVGDRWEYRSLPGTVGSDTAQVLREAGFADDEIAKFHDAGIVATGSNA